MLFFRRQGKLDWRRAIKCGTKCGWIKGKEGWGWGVSVGGGEGNEVHPHWRRLDRGTVKHASETG